MTSFQDRILTQLACGQEIQRIISNFKKDSPGRKTSRVYFEERLLRLQEQWKNFEQGDLKIKGIPSTEYNHEYFTKNYFKEIHALYQQYTNIFEEAILSLEKLEKSSTSTTGNTEGPEPSKMTSSIRRQRAIMCSLERLLDGLSIHDNEPSQYHEVKFRSIEQLWQQIESVNYTIWELSDDPVKEGYNHSEFINMEQRVQQAFVTLSMKIQPQVSSNHDMSIVKNNSLHLPKVIIPKFDGDYMKWRQFFDLFSQMVDKQTIPNIQKMWYLKTHLSGEAENLIRHLSLTEDNYKTAWTSLQDRYNNIRVLTSTLLQKIIGQSNHTQPQPSASAIKNLHDTTQECLMALGNIGVDTATWDPILLHLLVNKLDQSTRILYEQSLAKPKELQSIKEFLSFLENQFQSLESVGQKKKDPTPRACASVISQRKATCKICQSGTHPVFACKQFLQLQTQERIQMVQKLKGCLNCLKIGHGVKNCMSRGCLKCNQKHNTLLHLESHNNNKQVTNIEGDRNSRSQVSLSASKNPEGHHYIFLSTAIVELITNNGQRFECRAVLDSGSQVNLITERLVKKLGLHSNLTSISIEGIGNGKRKSHERINVKLQSRTSGFSTQLEAFVLPNIISPQPSQHFNISSWAIPKNVPLADPFFNRPDKIDILLGAEFYHQLLCIGQIRLSDDLPTLQNTVLGWVIAGRVTETKSNTATCGISTYNDNDLHQMIERLWSLEEVETQASNLSRDEEMCEAHFAQNTIKNTEGRFIVKLPFHGDTSSLGESKEIAINRFLALERRLNKNKELKDQYIQFMEQYEDLGHMTKIDINNILTPSYFIPHHCVFKEDSSTTKLRVVFDASSKTSSGLSLNDIMYTGPTVQGELFSLLLRFRLPRYVFCTDIQKMYRQIIIHPEDRKYQTIVWRTDEKAPLNYYELNTVTYGTRAAPYLATKCLQQLAKENSERFPLGSKALHNDFYVDDCLTGDNSLVTTLEIQNQVTQLLKEAGFKLRKWCANHPRLLQGIAKEDQEINLDFGNESIESIKALGLTWQPKNDRFCVKTKLNSTNRITKRIVTSDLAKLFDPLGIMAPVVVTAKIFVQELWSLKLSWDESLPVELHTRWMQFRENLKCLNNFHFSRHMFNNDVPARVQIHTFTDASEKAYGTVVYLRAILKNGTIIVRLLCSKSRVAPLKKQTLPRLELCAAVLGAQLTARVKNDLNLKDVPTFLWTDSEIVLAWINSPSASFQTFVANRVSSIQRLTLAEQWRHVSSKHNPADVISRGLQPEKFTSCTIWFYGPLFLHGQDNGWPASYSKGLQIADNSERKRPITVATVIQNCDQNMIYKINHRESFNTLQRIVSYMRRFCNHARNKEGVREIHLTTRELEQSLVVIIRAIQAFDFKEEISDLQKYKELKGNSQFSSLSPFLDDKGIVRVGGRLDAGLLPFDTKHPMLLPYNNPLTKLLMKEIHEQHKHCGPQTLLAQMRQRFWPIKGKIMARSIVHHCIKCTRARPQLLQQVMGNLPSPRITPARPFINSGVDYCGPFWIHYKIRGKRPQKAYVAIFCCFATKAVHIELVSDLTTESFLGALKRFIGRRGHCQNIYCDNATNFVGANNQLNELYGTIYSEDAREIISRECSGHAIQFNFIPPRAPHFGGLWEAAVKSAKHLLKRSVATASLTYEELETVLIGIEAILNSRPLTPLSSDPNDLTALTPGHFLIGEPLTAKTDVNATPLKQSLLKRWNLVSHLKHEFWKRWSQEYLQELQYRYKWKECSKNIKEGDMVIIKEDNIPSLQWPLGRIVKTFKGDDGAIRVAEVKTASGVWKRPIHRLAPLPMEKEINDDVTLGDEDERAEINSSEPVHEIPAKRRKTSSAIGITSILTILILIPLVMGSEIQINKFKPNLGIHFEGLGTAKLATSEWNFIIHYNLDPLLEEYSAFVNGTLTLNHLCQQMQRQSICINTVNQFQHIKNELASENNIFQAKRTKRGAANFIGNIANSLFGVLDSEYATQMTRTIDQVKENENHLLHLLKNQTSVIDSTINIVKQNDEIISHRFDQINNQLKEIISRIRDNGEESHQIKIFQIFSSLSSQLIIMMLNIQRMQSTLIDVLTDTHHGKVSSLLISARQLKDELKTIKAHLPSFLELPANEEDLIQLYRLMRVKGGVTDRQAVFLITLPLVIQESYELFKMTPIPNILNNVTLIIDLCAPILAVNAHRDQYIPIQSSNLDSCTTLRSEQFLCFDLQARYNKGSEFCSCELGLFNNETRPTCSLKRTETNSTWIQMQHKNQWLYFTKTPSRLTAICGRRNLHMDLVGAGILTLQPGCILKQNHITIESHNTFSTNLQTSYTSFGNISEISTPIHHEPLLQTFNITQYRIQLKNLTDLQQIIAEREVLELPHKLKLHTYHNFAIGYLALLLTIILIIYLLWKRKSKSSGISIKPNPKPRQTKPESDFIVTVT